MSETTQREELTIKFGKGLAELFTSKDGKEFMRIKIPNRDQNDHSPWMSFVLPAKAVHENQYGNGLWAKIPADATTTLSRSVKTGEENGQPKWEKEQKTVSNHELKEMVEAYKTREERGADTGDQKRSVLKDLKEKKAKTAAKSAVKEEKPELPFR